MKNSAVKNLKICDQKVTKLCSKYKICFVTKKWLNSSVKSSRPSGGYNFTAGFSHFLITNFKWLKSAVKKSENLCSKSDQTLQWKNQRKLWQKSDQTLQWKNQRKLWQKSDQTLQWKIGVAPLLGGHLGGATPKKHHVWGGVCQLDWYTFLICILWGKTWKS